MPLEVIANHEIPANKEISTSSDSPLHKELGDNFASKCGQEQISRTESSVVHESKTNQDGTQPLLPSLEIEGDAGSKGPEAKKQSKLEKEITEEPKEAPKEPRDEPDKKVQDKAEPTPRKK